MGIKYYINKFACSRMSFTAAGFLVSCYTFAQYSNGATRYNLSAQALSEMTLTVVQTMGYVISILFCIATLTAVYNATVIYIKMNTGEGGFTKSVVMLVGAILFLIAASLILPSFFGFRFGSGWEASTVEGWASPFGG